MCADDEAASLLKARYESRSKLSPASDLVVLLTRPQDLFSKVGFSTGPLTRAEEVNRVEKLSGIEPNMADGERLLNAFRRGKDTGATYRYSQVDPSDLNDWFMKGGTSEQVRDDLNATGVFQTPSGRKAERLIASQNATAFLIAHGKCAALPDHQTELRALSLSNAYLEEGRRDALVGRGNAHNLKKEELRRDMATFSGRKLNWGYSRELPFTLKVALSVHRKLTNEAKLHGVDKPINIAEYFANELASIPEADLDSPCTSAISAVKSGCALCIFVPYGFVLV